MLKSVGLVFVPAILGSIVVIIFYGLSVLLQVLPSRTSLIRPLLPPSSFIPSPYRFSEPSVMLMLSVGTGTVFLPYLLWIGGTPLPFSTPLLSFSPTGFLSAEFVVKFAPLFTYIAYLGVVFVTGNLDSPFIAMLYQPFAMTLRCALHLTPSSYSFLSAPGSKLKFSRMMGAALLSHLFLLYFSVRLFFSFFLLKNC